MVLEHTLSDGSSHFDLLIERASGEERRLVSFRCTEDPIGGAGEQTVERMGDHRAVYLAFEGDIGGGRGRVDRVASGVVDGLEESDGVVRCGVDWGSGRVVLELRRLEGEAWVLRRV